MSDDLETLKMMYADTMMENEKLLERYFNQMEKMGKMQSELDNDFFLINRLCFLLKEFGLTNEQIQKKVSDLSHTANWNFMDLFNKNIQMTI